MPSFKFRERMVFPHFSSSLFFSVMYIIDCATMGILCQNDTLWSRGKDSRTKTIDLEISLLHHGIFVMIPLSTLTEKSKLNVEYRSQLLFGFQINFSVFCAGHPLDNIASSWIKRNTTPRVTRQRCRPATSLQLDQQKTEWSKMVETSSRTQHRRANRKRLDTSL